MMERTTGIEPVLRLWQSRVLPLNYVSMETVRHQRPLADQRSRRRGWTDGQSIRSALSDGVVLW